MKEKEHDLRTLSRGALLNWGTVFQQCRLPAQGSSSPCLSVKKEARLRSPSPSPPPKEFLRYLDAALKTLFPAVGFSQCLAGLEVDILVMNPDWEKRVVPEGLHDLQSSILVCLSAFEPRRARRVVMTLKSHGHGSLATIECTSNLYRSS